MRSTRTTLSGPAAGRSSERSARAVLALAIGAQSAVAACLGPLAPPIPAAHEADDTPRRGGVLRLASFQDVRTLDPAAPTDALALQAEHLLYAGLVDLDEHAQVVGDLAERWEVEDDGRTYRFFLRPGVLMHDGQELTAEDVKRSAERALHPATPDPNAALFEDLLGYDAYAGLRADHLDGVRVEGRYAVTFRLRQPDVAFLPALATHTLRPLCRSAGDRYVDSWAPCGAGPFKLPPGGWQRGSRLRLVRHEGYFRAGRPYLDAVEWTFNVQVAAQRFRFEDGALDVLRDMTHADEARFVADPRWRPFGGAEADRSIMGESMNTRVPPFDNVEIRRAVAAAIDREHYRMLKPANVTVLTQLLPPGLPWREAFAAGQRYDYPAALEHMRKAGYPYDPATGVGGWPEPIVYPLYDQGLLVYTAQLLQQDLAKIGLRIELRLVSWPAFLALQQRPGGAALSQGNWEPDYPDPSSVFEPLFTTRSIGADVSYNTSFYSNPRVDDLVARARGEPDSHRRASLYREANEIVCDDAPWAFAFSYHAYEVRQPYVRGFDPASAWSMDASGAWIDRARDALSRAIGLPAPGEAGALAGDRVAGRARRGGAW
ncbi:MAG TPA: ABC transporter substrate-binding protein [Polyangiaceae bacterium]|nr:ABC transporter substrate-binding protein [Polyangiaceae bacterium]